jgi:hypothetical protein
MKFKDIIKSILIKEDENGPSDHAKWVAKQVLVKFMFADKKEQKGFVADYDLTVNGESFFVLDPGSGQEYWLEYTFEIDVTSYPSFTAPTWDDPGDYDPAEYDFVITGLSVLENNAAIYKGPDFTNFLTLKTGEVDSRYGSSRKLDGADFLYDFFGESIEEVLNDNAD